MNAALDVINRELEYYKITATWTRGFDGEGEAQVAERHVTIPTPTSPSRVAVALHEVAHVVLDRPDLPDWRNEARASRWALLVWRSEGWPDYELAAFALGSRLHGYLRTALERGEATVEDIERHIPEFEPEDLAHGGPNGLLPYARRFGLRERVDPEPDRRKDWALVARSRRR